MGSVLAAVYILVVLLIFFALGVFLKRHVLNRHPLPTAAQQAGLSAMALFQTPEQRSAVEELEYTKKDRTDEAKAGEGLRRRPGGAGGVVPPNAHEPGNH